MTTRYVLDTNIVTALLRHNPQVIQNISRAATRGADLFLCPVVFYELLRGLLHKDARKQLQYFLEIAAALTWNDFSHGDWQKAAELWADLRRQGCSIGDADLLIGVYALQRQATIVTANEKHFEPLNVQFENWLK